MLICTMSQARALSLHTELMNNTPRVAILERDVPRSNKLSHSACQPRHHRRSEILRLPSRPTVLPSTKNEFLDRRGTPSPDRVRSFSRGFRVRVGGLATAVQTGAGARVQQWVARRVERHGRTPEWTSALENAARRDLPGALGAPLSSVCLPNTLAARVQTLRI